VKAFLATLALAMLGSGLSAAGAAPAGGCAHTYADDFSTNAVATDSYSHSMIQAQFCTTCSAGWLMFVTDSTGNRGLGLYSGMAFYPGYPAHLAYRFPPEGGAGGMTGTLEFDALPAPSLAAGWGFGPAQAVIAYDDVRAVTVDPLQVGHYTFDLVPPPTVDKVYLFFVGSMNRLDNLAVCLDTPTPTGVATWGRLKSIYR
jgi:hypothetical protein